MISQELLKKYVSYNPETGIMLWKEKTSKKSLRSIIGEEVGCYSNGYKSVAILGRTYKVHRLAWLYFYGYLPEFNIDHIDGDKENNRISNLRDVKNSDNCRNAKLRFDNKTGVPGVNFCSTHKRYKVRIGGGKIRVSLGYFSDFFEACCARKSAEKKYNYHENHGRI